MASTPDDSPQINPQLEEEVVQLWEFIKPDDPVAAEELLLKIYAYWHIKAMPYD